MKHVTDPKDHYTVTDNDGGRFETIWLQALNEKKWTEPKDLLKKIRKIKNRERQKGKSTGGKESLKKKFRVVIVKVGITTGL